MAETDTRTIDSNGNTVVTSSEGLSYTIVNNGTAPGVPVPSYGSLPATDKPSGSSPGAPAPKPRAMYEIKEKLLRPALTSHFECNFNPPNDVRSYILANRKFNYNNNVELLSLSCSEASLPGSSLMTNEITDDYTGVTERLAYRRQYDDRADFTFYVDYGRQDGNYNIIWFFENWIAYIANEQFLGGQGIEAPNYSYRFRFPDGRKPKGSGTGSGYRTTITINKFERDFSGQYLSYRFIKAYPISIDSMPVSYDSSELLKCTVSFTYNRYVIDRLNAPVIPSEPKQPTPPGIPVPPITTETGSVIQRNLPQVTSPTTGSRPIPELPGSVQTVA